MKMLPEHYNHIKAALDAVLAFKPENAWDETLQVYLESGLTRRRMRWDCFWTAMRIVAGPHTPPTKWVCDVLYPYLNDDHIDTALRHYFGHGVS